MFLQLHFSLVNPLHTNLQVVNVYLPVQPHKLVHVSGVRCHTRASSTRGCAFVHFTVQNYRVQYLYFKPRISRASVKTLVM